MDLCNNNNFYSWWWRDRGRKCWKKMFNTFLSCFVQVVPLISRESDAHLLKSTIDNKFQKSELAIANWIFHLIGIVFIEGFLFKDSAEGLNRNGRLHEKGSNRSQNTENFKWNWKMKLYYVNAEVSHQKTPVCDLDAKSPKRTKEVIIYIWYEFIQTYRLDILRLWSFRWNIFSSSQVMEQYGNIALSMDVLRKSWISKFCRNESRITILIIWNIFCHVLVGHVLNVKIIKQFFKHVTYIFCS